jgi:serine/threonine-protein kinase RIO1
MQLQSATLLCLKKTRRGPAERTLRVARGRSDWCVRERWRTAILGPKSPNWFQLSEDPRAQLVKKGHQRSVWRVRIENETYFAKAFEVSGSADSVKGMVVGRAAEREFRALIRAEASGVPVVKSLAVGLLDEEPRRAVLITLACPEAIRLTDAWRQRVLEAKAAKRRNQADTLINLSAALFSIAHEAGFMHPDAHPQNILIGCGPDDQPLIVFADVHDARFRDRPLSLEQGIGLLAHLDQYFHRCATRTQRLRFLRRYLGACPSVGRIAPSSAQERAVLALHARLRKRHAEQLAKRRDRRLFANGKYFANVDLHDGWRATLALELERRHVFPERNVPDRTLDDWRIVLPGIVNTARPDARVAEPAAMESDDTPAIEDNRELRIVSMNFDNPATRFIHTLVGNPHGRTFVQSHRRRHRDEPAELILGYLEHRSWGLVDQTMLLYPSPEPEPVSTRSRKRTTVPPTAIGA